MDLERFCDIDRYRHVNINAQRPEDVEERALSDVEAAAFLRRTMKELEQVDVLVPGSDSVFARSIDGRTIVAVFQVPEAIDCEIFGQFEKTYMEFETQKSDAFDDTIGS